MNRPRDGFVARVRRPPVECKTFLHSDNPRVRSCRVCGRTPETHPVVKAPARDEETEAQFFADIVTMAQRVTGIWNPEYVTRVMSRLALGRERYGDGNFMEKDVLSEVLDETPDIAGYGVLELHKQKALGCAPQRYANLYQDLLAAAAYGCVADFYAQRAARRLAGGTQ